MCYKTHQVAQLTKKSGEYAPIPLDIVCAVTHYLLFFYKNEYFYHSFFKILAKYSPKRTIFKNFPGEACPRTPITDAWRIRAMQIPPLFQKYFEPPPRNEILDILRPKLEYASAVWDPFTEDNIRKLEAVQRRAARFVCNSYRQTASVSSMLSELSWPLLEQRHAEARLGLFHRIVHKSVDIDVATLMTRSTRPTRKANEVQYTRHMTSKDCYKFWFIPRTIIQWNGIAARGDFNQYKSDLKSHDLTLSEPSYNY